MLLITEFADRECAAQWSLLLDYQIRQKARFKAKLNNGDEVGVQLQRGHILRGGDKLRAENGHIIEIISAKENVSTVIANAELLARICYHLGNRHVPLQVSNGWCRYQHDHVLNEMVIGLGGELTVHLAVFEPESGAYASSGPHHQHSHHHSHV